MWFDLVGVTGTLLGASITFFATAQIESSWAGRSDANALKLTRALTELAIYAPPAVVDEISKYTRTNCLDIDDREERCKKLWISVLSQLRHWLYQRRQVSSVRAKSRCWLFEG